MERATTALLQKSILEIPRKCLLYVEILNFALYCETLKTFNFIVLKHEILDVIK